MRQSRAAIAVAPSGDFTTSFPATEAHLSQGGIWTIGDNSGLNAGTGPQTTGGAPGACFVHAGDGVDYLGTLQSRFSPTQHYAQFTVKRTVGYIAPDTQECELLIGFTLASGVASGYELDFWFGGAVIQGVRWNNGATNDYDFGAVTELSGTWPGALVDGDVVKAIYDSSSGSPVITVLVNGSTAVVLTDTTAGKILSGSPGLGFFARTGTGFDATGYCVKGFAAGNA